jgi:DNA polymerase-3 subunit alpha
MADFVHLHNHTEFSLLDGLQKMKNMVAYAKSLGMPALAIMMR